MATTAVKTAELIKLRNILYPTDFSEPSEMALPFATALARRYDASLHVLNVITPNAFAASTPELAGMALDAEREMAFESLRQLESQLAGLHHETIVERALSVWDGVGQAIEDCSADLIVLGTHGRTGAQRLLLGSVAEEVFRRSERPVLTVGPNVRTSCHNGGRFHRILFATDYSPASAAAAPYAVSLAENNEARLLLLHVARVAETRKADHAREESVAEMIHRLYDTIPGEAKLSIPAEVAIAYGKPAEKIIETAAERSADLIVLGVRSARGHLGSATHLERPTAHEIVSRAMCPVLTVRE
ncbi:MAG TPA: universal stress protein [Candidatus Limnocylindrales bacterium]|nr:universal stress protein [Candidatus Limnocylindrales bacterium]